MYKYSRLSGVGQEEFGPPAPNITQQVAQTVHDIDQTVEEHTGLRNFAMYVGVGLAGWVLWNYMNE